MTHGLMNRRRDDDLDDMILCPPWSIPSISISFLLNHVFQISCSLFPCHSHIAKKYKNVVVESLWLTYFSNHFVEAFQRERFPEKAIS